MENNNIECTLGTKVPRFICIRKCHKPEKSSYESKLSTVETVLGDAFKGRLNIKSVGWMPRH